MRVAILSTLTAAVLALSLKHDGLGSSHGGTLFKRETIAGGTKLRILPLGDSITVGVQSSDDNGYRGPLQQALAGSKLVFVGDLINGTMRNGLNAGYSGYTINEISSAADHAITTYKPNIILLHAGTNDLDRGGKEKDPIPGAPDRLGQLIDKCVSSNPDAAILVAQIINAEDGLTESNIQTFNKAIPGLVKQRADQGHHVSVVDMTSITTGDLSDGLHPSDAGYRKMANVWLDAIKVIASKGWIKEPTGPDPGNASNSGSCVKRRAIAAKSCTNTPIWNNPAPDNGLIASGVAEGGEAKFVPDWQPKGRVALGIDKNGSNVRFADLNADGRADYLWVDDDTGAVIAYLNTGKGNDITWAALNDGKPIALGVGKGKGVHFANMGGQKQVDYLYVDEKSGIGKGAGVRFADYDGDGRDDYIWLSEEGKAFIYINYVGEIAENWKGLNDGKYIALGVGARREDVRLADLDGDRRADYIWVHPFDGSINVWRNAFDKGPGTWTPYDKKLALGVGVAGANVRFARISGEHTGRADYVAVEPGSGGLRVWLNLCDKLAPGQGSNVEANGALVDCDGPDITSPNNNSPSSGNNGSPTGNGPSSNNGPQIVIGGSTFTANSQTQVVIDGQTLTPGGQIVAGGTTISLASDASIAVVGGTTQTLARPGQAASTLVFGGTTYTANSASQFVIAGQTLAPNGQLTVSGTVISLGSGTVVIGSSTSLIGPTRGATLTPPSVFTVRGSTFTADSATRIVIDGQTLTPGGKVVVDGTTIKLPSDATAIIVNGTPQPPVQQSPTVGPSPGPSANGPTSPEVTQGPTGPSTDSSGNGDGITIPDFTTVLSAPSLGTLPKSGQAAISALKPAANAFVDGLNDVGCLISGLFGALFGGGGCDGRGGGGLTSGAVSTAAASLTTVIEDGERLLNGMEAFEMSSFSEGATNLVSEINSAKTGLRNLIDFLRPTAREFGRFIKEPPSGLNDYRRISTYLGGTVGAGSLAFGIGQIFNGPIVATTSSSKPQSPGADATSKTATSTSSSSSASESPREWLLNTVPGTSESAFESFVSSLPDKGKGRRKTPSFLNFQYYVGAMTLEEARAVNKNPIVDQLVWNGPVQAHYTRDHTPEVRKPHHRRDNPLIAVQERAPLHLRILSLPRTDTIAGLDQSIDRTNYFFEDSTGDKDTWLYILDSGFVINQPEFNYRPPGASNTLHAMPWAGSADVDETNHGTCVASMAIGNIVGVKTHANFVGVKISGPAQITTTGQFFLSAEEMVDSYLYVIKDVTDNDRRGRTVTSLSLVLPFQDLIDHNGHFDYGDINIPIGQYSDHFWPILRECWRLDIVTIFGGGNTPDNKLGDWTPQRYGRANNALITVDSMNGDGSRWDRATPSGPSRAGVDPDLRGWIDLIAHSVGVPCRDSNGGFVGTSGASVAVPQVAALAANLLGSPFEYPYPEGKVSLGIKSRLVGLSRGPGTPIKPASPDGFQAAYNGVRELFCAAGLPPKVKARTAAFSTENPGNNHFLAEVVSKINTFSLLAEPELSSGGYSASPTLSNNDSIIHESTTLRTQKAVSASKRSQLLERQGLVPERPPVPTITVDSPDTEPATTPQPTTMTSTQKPSGLDLPATTLTNLDDIGFSCGLSSS